MDKKPNKPHRGSECHKPEKFPDQGLNLSVLPPKEALSLNHWIAKEVLEIISCPLQPTENSPVLIMGSSH